MMIHSTAGSEELERRTRELAPSCERVAARESPPDTVQLVRHETPTLKRRRAITPGCPAFVDIISAGLGCASVSAGPLTDDEVEDTTESPLKRRK
ncbi:MAG: hypothetical protein SGPRY_008058 [Prymnesium sp.]